MDTRKLAKAAGIVDQIAKICSGIFKAIVIVTLIFAVLVVIFGEKMYASGSLTAEFGFVKLYLAPEYQGITSMTKVYTVVALLCSAVSCAMLSCICSMLRQLLAPMKEGRPFERSVPADLRKIAWITLVGGALNQVLKLVEQLFVIKALPMDRIFSGDAVVSRNYVFLFNGNFILIFFLIMFLSYIFSYGQSLQQEADETV